MAKVKVLIPFVDKHTDTIHDAGEVFEADEARIAEIRSTIPEAVQVLMERKKGDD